MKIEFHVHTKYSSDSMLNRYALLLFCKIRKIEMIAITDHNTIEGAQKYKNFCEKNGIKVIVGEEIFTTEGEIIGLFLKKGISPYMSLEQTIWEIKKQEGLIYIPHPYDEKRWKTVLKEDALERNKYNIDFIEIHNGRNSCRRYSEKQKEIADKTDAVKVVGGDAHICWEIGRNYMETDREVTRKTIKKVIKDALYEKSDCIPFSHKWTKLVKIYKVLVGWNYEIFKKKYQ